MLEVYKDGRVTYNGQDWTTPIHTLCGRAQRIVTTPETVLDVQAIKDDMVVTEIRAPEAIEAKIPSTVTTKVITDKPELLQGGSY